MSIPTSSLRSSLRRSACTRNQVLATAVLVAVGARLPAQEQFAPQSLALPGFDVLSHATGDIDGDGDLDLAVGGFAQGGGLAPRLFVLANDGRGGFSDVTPSLWAPDSAFQALAFGDVDGDGDLDLLVGDFGRYAVVYSPGGRQNRLLINDGAGTFTEETASRLPARSERTAAIALGDVDGDGDLDVIEGNGGYRVGFYGVSGQTNRLLINDGSGVFTDVTASQMPNVTDMTNAVAVGDVDGDGDLDLVFGNGFVDVYYAPFTGQQNRLLLNDGSGTFTDVTATQLPVDAQMTMAVALGDVDGDGDLDLVAGNGQYVGPFAPPWLTPDAQNALLLNDGAGGFSNAVGLPIRQDNTRAVALADLDEDGDVEVLFGNTGGGGFQGWTLLDNDGAATFLGVTTQRLAGPTGSLQSIAVADIDGDGDQDLIDDQSVARNLLRHLDAPAAPTVGQAYQLDVYARYGAPRLFDVALPYLSLAPGSVAVPGLGTIGIDLAQAAPLDPLLIAQPAGVASTAFMVPNNAALVGLELFAQAAHVPFPLPVQFTNATRSVVQ